MDDKHRDHIEKNLDKLVSLTDYKRLMTGCINAQVLSPVMRNNIEKLPADNRLDQQHRWHRELFRKVMRRGPEAYNKLKIVLSDLNCEAAVRLLNAPTNGDTQFVNLNQRPKPAPQEREEINSTRITNNDFDNMPRLEPYTGVINPTVVRKVIPATGIQTDSKLLVYPMDAQENRGVLFIANIIDFRTEEKRRNGAEEDAQSLLHLFKNLGFVLFFYQNLSQMQFLHLLDELIASKYAQAAQCFVMALMTHGTDERVQFSDDSYLELKAITDRFKNSNCTLLLDKPKILLFPFCRGDVVDKGSPQHSKEPEHIIHTDGVGSTKNFNLHATVPSFSDLIICYASVRGHQTLRDPHTGSWYVQSFCENMAKYCHDTQFENIIKLIQAELSKLRGPKNEQQMGTYENIGFNKALYFNPGVWR